MRSATFTICRPDTGAVLPYAVVTVYQTDGVTKASLFNALDVPLSNPVTADQNGAITFQAQEGVYVLSAVSADGSLTVPTIIVELLLSRVPYPVPTRSALKAIDTTRYTVAHLTEAGRCGTFFWTNGDFSSLITADPLEGIYIKADAIVASSGAWVRDTLVLRPEFFGAKGDDTTNDWAALQAAANLQANGRWAPGGIARKWNVELGLGSYRLTQTLTIGGDRVVWRGQGNQATAIDIDHTSGAGIFFSGGGLAQFRGFTITPSPTRQASTDASLHGFVSDPGTSATTYRMILEDVYSTDHPGDNFRLIQPEQLIMKACYGNRSTQGHGCYVWGRNVINVGNVIDHCGFDDNAGNGLNIVDMTNGAIFGPRAINNKGAGGQIRIVGDNWTVHDVDCEAFNLIDTTTPPTGGYIGLSLTGRCHRVIGGNFYALTKAIRLSNCDDSVIMPGNMGGKSVSFPMAVGVSFESGSDFNYLKMSTFTGNFVTANYDLAGGSRNTISQRGVLTMGDALVLPAVEALTTGAFTDLGGGNYSYTPDASQGSSFRLQPPGPLTINFPTNLTKGQELEFIIQQDGTGGRTVTWDSSYNAKWTNVGNTAGLSSTAKFRATGTTVMQQSAAQSPYVLDRVAVASVAFGGTTVNAGAVSSIPTVTGVGGALLASGFAVDATCSVNLAGLRLYAWISADNTISYQFHNPTAGNITLGACTLRFRVRRID